MNKFSDFFSLLQSWIQLSVSSTTRISDSSRDLSTLQWHFFSESFNNALTEFLFRDILHRPLLFTFCCIAKQTILLHYSRSFRTICCFFANFPKLTGSRIIRKHINLEHYGYLLKYTSKTFKILSQFSRKDESSMWEKINLKSLFFGM